MKKESFLPDCVTFGNCFSGLNYDTGDEKKLLLLDSRSSTSLAPTTERGGTIFWRSRNRWKRDTGKERKREREGKINYAGQSGSYDF